MFGRKKKAEEVQLPAQEEPPVKMLPKDTRLKETLLDINSLLLYMTGLDYVSDMVFIANDQEKTLSAVSDSSAQLAVSTEDIAHNVEDSSESMMCTTQETEQSLSQINQTFGAIENHIQEMNKAGEIMEGVSEETEKINELVNVIKSVASQTNLLSLNASIEAARAGDLGKGFSVVANEIKKLAENTQQQVEFIQNIVGGLSEKINMASEEIRKVVSSFSESKESIDSATSGIERITGTLSTVNESFASISANVEEQSATTQVITNNIQHVSDQSASLLNHVEKTGQAFFDISVKLFDIRAKSVADAGETDTATMVELIKADHLMWKWRVYNMILGFVHLDEATVGDHTGCRLGKWVQTLDTSNPNVAALLKKMETPHAGVHQSAKKAIRAYNSHNVEEAKKHLAELDTYSSEVVTLISELGKIL